MSTGKETKKMQAVTNLKKTKGLLEKMIEMLESDKYCIEIMNQNLAAIGMLRVAHEMLMEDHLEKCFKEAIKESNPKLQKKMVEEILKVTRLFNR